MRKVRRELQFLRYEIQRDRATLRALRRHSSRMHGREVIDFGNTPDAEADAEADAERIELECGVVPDNPRTMQLFIDASVRDLEEKKARVAQLKHKLETQLPLTPWGMAIALLKVWYRQIRT